MLAALQKDMLIYQSINKSLFVTSNLIKQMTSNLTGQQGTPVAKLNK